LEECFLSLNIRTASLESRIRQNARNAEEFDGTKQQIAFLDTTITRLNEETVIRFREHQNLLSSVASTEQSQKELKEQNVIQQKLSLQLSSVERDVLQLRKKH
jgi:hypothetical protein